MTITPPQEHECRCGSRKQPRYPVCRECLRTADPQLWITINHRESSLFKRTKALFDLLNHAEGRKSA